MVLLSTHNMFWLRNKKSKKGVGKQRSITYIDETMSIYHECEGRIEKSVLEERRLVSRGLPSDDKQ